MSITAGIDVGSTYTKAVLMDEAFRIVGRSLQPTGFKLAEVAQIPHGYLENQVFMPIVVRGRELLWRRGA